VTRVRIAAAVAVVAVIGIAAVFWARFGTDPRAVRSPLVGRSAPAEQLQRLDGTGTISLQDYRGSVVVVNFFASWCVPCRAEHAELTRAATEWQPQGVRFLGVVYQDKPAAVQQFLTQLGRPYDVVTDPDSRAAIDFGMFGVPETFFIDRDGRIAGKVAGPVNAALVSANVERLLGASAQ
jgi:cytochrome c biogenesis protein CcmG/thiol:disulfide interchange protein DsbE